MRAILERQSKKVYAWLRCVVRNKHTACSTCINDRIGTVSRSQGQRLGP